MNLATLLVDAQVAQGRGGHAALRSGDESLSYGELRRRIDRTGNALRALGVRRGDRVALLLADGPDFIASFLGAAKLGAVPVTLSTHLRPADHAYQLRHCGARVAVVEPPLRMAAEAVGVPCVVDDIAARAAAAAAMLEAAPTADDEPCFWQYSSGTTGHAKAVVHRHRGAAAPAECHGTHVARIGPDDVVYSVPKLFFSYGLNNSLTIPLRFGATVVLHGARPEPRAVLDLIARERVTAFYAVPTFYAQLLAAVEDGAPADLSSVRLCISAGEALPRAIFERWRARFGREILDGIGSTEIGYIAISNFAGRARAGTSGQVIPGYEARVVDEHGADVRAGEVGELWVRGPSQAVGYWDDPERTARTFRDGWVATGDRYLRDADGYFTNLGRTDDMLKVGGIWVSPLEVESVLLEHAAVLECAVVPRQDADELTKPFAWVVLREGRRGDDALATELRAFVKGRLAPYKYPRWIEFVPELPKTTTGKIQRFALRQSA